MRQIDKRQTVRRILIFAVLVNGLAWLGPLLGGSPAEPGLGFLLWGAAPLLATLVMKIVLRDPVDLGLRPRLRGNGRWYALSLLVYPASFALVLAAGLLLDAVSLTAFSAGTVARALLPLAVTYFVFGFFEEIGWRGYLTPTVYGLNGRLAGHALVGLIWASWHFPYVRELWAHTGEGLPTLLPRFILGTLISAIVYGEIRLRSGSVWPAVLMHWAGNTLANTLLTGFAGAGMVTLAAGQVWLVSFGVEGVLMMGLFGLLGAALYRARVHGRSEVVERVGKRPSPSL